MVFWICMAVGFVVVVAVIWMFARRIDRIESDSTSTADEQPFSPHGQQYLDILRGRGSDDD